MEIEQEDEKSIDSFQAEMDLVKEEEEEENKLSQKERLDLILAKIKPQSEEKNDQVQNIPPEQSENKPNVLRAGAPKKTAAQNVKSAIPDPFDPNFKLNDRYFYQNINLNEWNEITNFVNKFIKEDLGEQDLEEFFEQHPNISKGNIHHLQGSIDTIFSQNKDLKKYKILTNFLIKKYYKPKPVICECYFFPNPSNEQRVVNMFRTCKKTLDIAIFTFTRDSIAQAILEAKQRGVQIRCIGDDGNSKVKGSDVRLLASQGIPCKTDNNLRFHMHNKMAIIDNSVVITGSFNWTNQAINKNQDNILFIEDKNIANQYTQYYNQIWDSFNTVITKEDADKYIENEKNAKEKKDQEKEEKNKNAEKQETTKKETAKKETAKKETAKKETAKKETAKKETTKKETAKKETTKKETTKKETTKKETAKKETTKKETTKKETTKKETAKKETTKKETTKKDTTKKDTSKKEKAKTETKQADSKKEPKAKEKPSDSKAKSTKEKSKGKNSKEKRTKTMKEIKKSSAVKSKEKTSKLSKEKNEKTTKKAKTTKEKKKEKVEKSKAKTTKRVRGVKSTTKSTSTKKKK